MKPLSLFRLKELANYDPETGVWTHAKARANVFVGYVAGTLTKYGYIHVRLDGQGYFAHRLAFLWMTGEFPPGEVDHINLDRADNRWANLRAATHSQNMMNRRPASNNKSGLKGVWYCKATRKWLASIMVQRVAIHLGSHDTFEAARSARMSAEPLHHGQFRRIA